MLYKVNMMQELKFQLIVLIHCKLFLFPTKPLDKQDESVCLYATGMYSTPS